MRANELCERTAERLAELRIGAFIPGDEENVLFLAAPEPCLIVCRARLREKSKEILERAGELPVLLVRNERDIERVAQLLSYAAANPDEVELILSSLAMWRAAR